MFSVKCSGNKYKYRIRVKKQFNRNLWTVHNIFSFKNNDRRTPCFIDMLFFTLKYVSCIQTTTLLSVITISYKINLFIEQLRRWMKRLQKMNNKANKTQTNIVSNIKRSFTLHLRILDIVYILSSDCLMSQISPRYNPYVWSDREKY